MSLLTDAMEEFAIYDRVTIPDGMGGTMTSYTLGATIQAACVLSNSTEARIGQAQGLTAVYTITTRRNVILQYHDILRRVRDGKFFRVTSDGDDLSTPRSAGLDMRQVSAEEWSLAQDVES